MKKILLALIMVGIFAGVSLAATTPSVTTNGMSDTAPDQGVKKPKHKHHKGKGHKKAKKMDKKDQTGGVEVNAAK